MKEVLTLNEAAELLSLSRQTVVKRALAGEIPGARVGKQWRFWRSKLLELIDGSRNAKAS